MKNLFLLFIPILFFFTACSSDDDNDNNQVDLTVDIRGSWDVTGLDYEGESEVVFDGQTLTLTYDGFGKDFDAQVVFSENPNTVETFGSYTIVLTVNFMGQNQTEEYPVDLSDDFSTGSWSIEGNQMVVIDSNTGEEQTSQIIQLTQNKMVLLTEQNIIEDGIEISITLEMTLER